MKKTKNEFGGLNRKYDAAVHLQKEGKYNEAIEILEDLKTSCPPPHAQAAMIINRLASLYIAINNVAEAEKLFKTYVHGGLADDVKFNISYCIFISKEYGADTALPYFEALTKKFPQSAETYQAFSVDCEAYDLKKSIQLAHQAAKLNPQYDPAFSRLGHLYDELYQLTNNLEHLESSRQFYKKAVALNPARLNKHKKYEATPKLVVAEKPVAAAKVENEAYSPEALTESKKYYSGNNLKHISAVEDFLNSKKFKETKNMMSEFQKNTPNENIVNLWDHLSELTEKGNFVEANNELNNINKAVRAALAKSEISKGKEENVAPSFGLFDLLLAQQTRLDNGLEDASFKLSRARKN